MHVKAGMENMATDSREHFCKFLIYPHATSTLLSKLICLQICSHDFKFAHVTFNFTHLSLTLLNITHVSEISLGSL